MLEQHDSASAKMAELRSAEKTKTVKFRELMGQKLMAERFLSMLTAYGIE